MRGAFFLVGAAVFFLQGIAVAGREMDRKRALPEPPVIFVLTSSPGSLTPEAVFSCAKKIYANMEFPRASTGP